jgi:hypothetical protein
MKIKHILLILGLTVLLGLGYSLLIATGMTVTNHSLLYGRYFLWLWLLLPLTLALTLDSLQKSWQRYFVLALLFVWTINGARCLNLTHRGSFPLLDSMAIVGHDLAVERIRSQQPLVVMLAPSMKWQVWWNTLPYTTEPPDTYANDRGCFVQTDWLTVYDFLWTEQPIWLSDTTHLLLTPAYYGCTNIQQTKLVREYPTGGLRLYRVLR